MPEKIDTIRKSFLKCVGIEFNKYHFFNDTDKLLSNSI
jgi:hypothetical protein